MPEDPAALKALLQAALAERDQAQQRAEEQAARAQQQGKRADDLYLENLRLQLELERYKKWYYGPRADRLKSSGELAQALLELRRGTGAETGAPGGGRGGGRAGRGITAGEAARGAGARWPTSTNLPVTTHVYELSAEERACPCCGEERKEIGAEESWQIEYLPGHFERLQHVRKKYACASLRSCGGEAADAGGGAGGRADRARPGGAGTAGVHRHQQVFRLPAALPAGRHFRPPGIRDCARHAVGLVRGRGRPGRALVPPHGRARAGRRTWWPPTTPCCPC